MVMTFIVAGNYQQALDYAREHDLKRWRYVNWCSDLNGYTITKQEVVKIGTYYERPDWPEIEEVLAAIFAKNKRVIDE